MLTVIATAFLFECVTLCILAIGYALHAEKPRSKPRIHRKQEPMPVWVLGLEEALASL